MQHSNVSLMVLGEWEFRPAAIMRLLQTSDCYVDLYLLYQTSMRFLGGFKYGSSGRFFVWRGNLSILPKKHLHSVRFRKNMDFLYWDRLVSTWAML